MYIVIFILKNTLANPNTQQDYFLDGMKLKDIECVCVCVMVKLWMNDIFKKPLEMADKLTIYTSSYVIKNGWHFLAHHIH